MRNPREPHKALKALARDPEIMAEMWIEAIGLFAGALGIVAWIPQIRDVWVHERHEGISLTTFSVVTVALTLWLIYGVLVDSLAMIVANVFTLVVILAVLIGVRRLRKREVDPTS
jgi:MtN3 and saliva related transmembrane protein